MIIDSKLEFADKSALTTSTGTNIVNDVVDLGEAARIGDGKQMYACVQITESVTSGGNATIEFSFQHGTSTSLGTIVTTTGPIPKASLTEKTQLVMPLPPGHTYQRYIGIQAKVSGSNLTAGSVNAYVVSEVPPNWYAFKEANN